jgi:hypothetical protein
MPRRTRGSYMGWRQLHFDYSPSFSSLRLVFREILTRLWASSEAKFNALLEDVFIIWTWEVHSLIFQGENSRSDFNWLCLAMSLTRCWRYYFESEDFLEGENLRSLIGRRWCLCSVPFLEASLLEKMNFWCCFGGVRAVVSRNRSL